MVTILGITGSAGNAWLPERVTFFNDAMDAISADPERPRLETLLRKYG